MKNIFATRPVPAAAEIEKGAVRAVIDTVLPCVDNGRFPIKCVVGERVQVRAHCFTDGHDVLRVHLCWRAHEQSDFREVPMKPLGNDVWEAAFTPPSLGRYVYTCVAWVDSFDSWHHELTRRVDPADVRIAAQIGALEIAAAAARAEGADRIELQRWATELDAMAADPGFDIGSLKALALDEEYAALVRRHPDRRHEVRYPVELPLAVDRERARFSTWYELFPRSTSPQPGVHGTFKDVEARLPAIAAMGFDVLYFPPIHPIGRVQRKGPNNALASGPEDVGSPWAIGAAEGGHKSILPALGTPEDFRRLLARATEHGLEIALDIAFQCAPDHPYVKEHPDWFRWRPDGSVQYAENPPKKYQDIYPFNFECREWRELWAELKSVIDHWIGEGVRIFRVDNPHTKAFPFWEWAIGEVKREHPDTIFLAEAFTRPKVMHRLAKLGFSQSYTYFTWRNTKQELQAYFTELSSAPGIDYFRPNAWPNTPDILHEQLQTGEPAVYMARLVLAATLAANYGIYGPAYELREHLPRGPGSEEYLDSEKYQLRHWNHDDPASLAPFIARVNRIRHENPALQWDRSLRFLHIDNDRLLAYAKESPDGLNVIVTVVNLDPHEPQSGWLGLEPRSVGVPSSRAFQMHDLLSGQRFTWQGDWHYVRLDPRSVPAHIFVVRRRHGDERDFDYFL
ncbi:alpha-1,4-glucan--maltose-1-phosphate maltosyltransferase [Variovorax sp. Root411]|uniref:alpha-1,4-glucan--maltose-1-phosphate maltosyltransferase n=1 Tax=Variovorax sp. Root411 TaxID=1736530 RepID=UPI0006F8702B|nr:alpha-1,4-glucan--maltose-1-phosphate maltosyltransferase [Variovorax sp. Root411]KQW54315.1 alpha-1,4-glucan--maltose-1-phosphate maltosyltransferase [Variovorax sp. Root411]